MQLNYMTRTTPCTSAIVLRKNKAKSSRSMKRTPIAVLLTVFTVFSGICSLAIAVSVSDDQTALELGRKVLAIREAIQNPRGPNAMKAVTDLGHDQRYYVMVRGWLSYQLEGDMGIFDAAKGPTRDEVKERINFLRKAIRAIDLE